jgi:hypothetical protein
MIAGNSEGHASREVNTVEANPVLRRYDDAYSVAAEVVKHGRRLKAIGRVLLVGSLLLGGVSLLALIASLAPGAPQPNPFGGFGSPSPSLDGIAGVLVAGILGSYGASLTRNGTLLSAQGQLLLAQLDIAVHTSPFLDLEEKRAVLELPAPAPTGHVEETVACRQCAAVNPIANQYCESCGRRLETVPA